MLTPPEGLSDDSLAAAIGQGWDLTISSITYRAVGFGSHHWEAVDARGDRWFVTVDDLSTKRRALDEPEDVACDQLRSALATAQDLGRAGCDFVVAPVSTGAGAPLAQIDRRFAVAVYAHVDGESFAWSEFATPAHRQGVFDMVVALHAVPAGLTPQAPIDDFSIPHRDELEVGIEDNAGVNDAGPYAVRAATLLADNAATIRRHLARFDGLVKDARRESRPTVVTHGEPHPGNTMLTPGGWRLIDWDTLLIAPPERDLWSLDPGDGSIFEAYTHTTQTALVPSILDLYRRRWDLADIAVYVSRFRGEHAASADDEKSWNELCSLVAHLR